MPPITTSTKSLSDSRLDLQNIDPTAKTAFLVDLASKIKEHLEMENNVDFFK
jgi:hypothetical protein